MIRPVQNPARRGLTLFETAIGSALFAIGLLAAFQTVGRTTHAYESSSSRVVAEARLIAALERVQEILDSVIGDSLPLDSGDVLGSSDLIFREMIGADSGVAQEGPLMRLFSRLEPSEVPNGLDDDGDGLVDELELVFVRDADAGFPEEILLGGLRPLAAGELPDLIDNDDDGLIDEPGFVIRREADSLRIHLSAQGSARAEDIPFDIGIEGRVRLRN